MNIKRRLGRTAAGAAANLGICIVAGCALIAAATWATADSTPRRQARGTHVGAAPADMVVLSFSGNYTAQKFVRVHDDGTIDTTEFAVPAGQHLIVTDVDWAGYCSSSVQVMLRVWIENRTTASTRNLVYTAFAIVGNITSSGGSQYGGVTSSPVSGFAVGPGGRLVCDVVPHSTPTLAFTTTGSVGPTVILRGYLVQDQ